ncbi:MAG: hypothetical protein NTX92_09305 [Euryarchaeota archaeon]|jgi:hypothetical protein|nr:hypothetical protein [Euryarchaeota archaeon]
MSEEIKGFFKGEYNAKMYALYFTTNRLIVAKTASGLALGVAFGMIGRSIAKRSGNKRSESLGELSPDSILSADKQNYDIPYSAISTVEMKKPSMISKCVLRIYTTDNKKHQFLLDDKNAFDDQYNLMNSVLSSKLTVR